MPAGACAFRSAEPVDFEPSAEQRLIVATVRDFVLRELYPHEAEVERLDEVPPDLARAIREKAITAGLYAANMPAELGGGGLDAVSVVLVERELGRASYALQMLVERPSNILRACTGEQREHYLLPAIRGERHDCVAMTEPSAGSDVRSMTTAAKRDGADYVINGTKHFISHADVADFVILFAVTGVEQTTAGARGLITALLVDCDAPGLTIRRGPACVSNRGYHQCELSFTDCRVPASARLGEEGRGLELMGQWLGASRLTVAATSTGRAERVLEAAADWAARRHQFGTADRQVPGHRVPACRHGDGAGCCGVADIAGGRPPGLGSDDGRGRGHGEGCSPRKCSAG